MTHTHPHAVQPLSRPWHVLAWVLAALLGGTAMPLLAAPDDPPDVVVIVDTSRSMSERGMDPERTSLLVSKLLSDVVPGRLSVVRLLDLADDSDVLPHRMTDQTGTCREDASRTCRRVEQAGDWGELARRNRLGVLTRPHLGDSDFKRQLDRHLAQRSGNSSFYLSFRAAQGVFEADGERGNRTIIWLSDGRDEDPGRLQDALADVAALGVEVETVLFGRGDPTIPERLGLTPVKVGSPGELMGLLAQSFRRIMRAPFRVDHLVERQPEFVVQPRIETMWVVVWGDTSLASATLTGPSGVEHPVDDAADSQPRAGSYRVALIERPQAGRWHVATRGGGPGRAYAVVQRSSLAPVLLEPSQALPDTETRLIAAIAARNDRTPITEPGLLAESHLSAEVDGARIALNDLGQGADEQAGDGRFSGYHSFRRAGEQRVLLTLESPVAEARAEALVRVRGSLRFGRQRVDARFGRLGVDESRCVDLPAPVEHRGTIGMRLAMDDSPPSGHRLYLKLGDAILAADGGTVDWLQGAPLRACLDVGPRAPSSEGRGSPTMALGVAAAGASWPPLEIAPHWQVQGLGFWQRWGWLIVALLALLAAVIVALGFILPVRFSKTLAIGFTPELEDLDEYPPQSIHLWRGVHIGFYRNARAFLHPSFRIDGRTHGALARLEAQPGGAVRVSPQAGWALYRDQGGGDWHAIPVEGEIARLANVYRAGDLGPYFRLSAR